VLIPDDVEVLADLGDLYEANGRTVDAEAAYRRALDRDADYAEVHLRLARLLVQRKAASEARSHVEAALKLQPNRRAALDLLTELDALSVEAAR